MYICPSHPIIDHAEKRAFEREPPMAKNASGPFDTQDKGQYVNGLRTYETRREWRHGQVGLNLCIKIMCLI